MPIPLVFGTENELVCAVTAPGLNIQDKQDLEQGIAAYLLGHFSEKFFPGMARNISSNCRYFTTRSEMILNGMKEKLRGRGLESITEFCNGYMTPLGSRFYLDHGYFELASPECDDPFTQLACEMAQEELVAENFEELFGEHPLHPRLYKNVSDGQGNSQAAHRNFCMTAEGWRRTISYVNWKSAKYMRGFSREARLLVIWHVIEQILTGAGKYGDEYALLHELRTPEEIEELRNIFQISGRADFLEVISGGQTTHCRPIVNRRDEPLADSFKYGRYHCISGDANRAEWSHLFKMGLTAIVLGMIEDDALGNIDFYIADPVRAIKEISRDPTCKKSVEVINPQQDARLAYSPIEIMKMFLTAMDRYLAARAQRPWCERIVEKAKWAIWALEHEPDLLGYVLDWKIKERFEKIGRGRKNAFIRHLEYHALTGPIRLYERLCRNEEIETVISRDEIERYKKLPPETTRAYFRGNMIKRFYKEIDFSVTDWQRIVFNLSGRLNNKIVMPDPLALTKNECGDIFDRKDGVSLEHFESSMVPYFYREEEEERGTNHGWTGTEET
ncbi:MAG: proteasome accessory factor PafA2 family protein [bacterium]|nr:proteasome accessory factor PafA2 family protein [bacterium]